MIRGNVSSGIAAQVQAVIMGISSGLFSSVKVLASDLAVNRLGEIRRSRHVSTNIMQTIVWVSLM